MTEYSAELAMEICELVADGSSLRAVCEKLGLHRRSVRRWLAEHPEFEAAYERARRQQIDHFIDEIDEIARGVAGSESNALVAAARLRIDTIRWVAAKLLPHRYGERVELTGTGGDPLLPAWPAEGVSVERTQDKIALALLTALRASAERRMKEIQTGEEVMETLLPGAASAEVPDAD